MKVLVAIQNYKTFVTFHFKLCFSAVYWKVFMEELSAKGHPRNTLITTKRSIMADGTTDYFRT